VYGINSRPVRNVWLNARYRYYDYDNKTPHFEAVQLVGDWNVGSNIWENEPSSFKRQNIDLDASFTPLQYLAFGVGYGRENADRTFRIFEKTAEDMFRVSVDSVGNQYVTMRLKYELSNREGSGFDQHLLDEVGEQPGTRHFDIANRDRNRVTGLVTVTPIPQLGLNASYATGRDEYDETGFGLRDNKNTVYGVGFDVFPIDTVSFGASYGKEKYTALSYSRTANPLSPTNTTFLDPTRDWWTDQDDRVNTVNAYLDLIKAIPNTEIRIGYDLSDGKALYVYGIRPDATIPAPAQLTPLVNKLSSVRLDTMYFIRSNLGIGVTYWYEDYNVEDFSQNGTVINQIALPSTIYSGYLQRDYTGHATWFRLSYLW
jgi:hypothetical protein